MTIYDFIFTVDLPTSVVLISPESGIYHITWYIDLLAINIT